MQSYNACIRPLLKHHQVVIMPSGGETTLFKQFFFNWLDKDETTGPSDPYRFEKIARVPQVPFDAATLHEDKVMAAQHGMVDDGSGELQVSAMELTKLLTVSFL